MPADHQKQRTLLKHFNKLPLRAFHRISRCLGGRLPPALPKKLHTTGASPFYQITFWDALTSQACRGGSGHLPGSSDYQGYIMNSCHRSTPFFQAQGWHLQFLLLHFIFGFYTQTRGALVCRTGARIFLRQYSLLPGMFKPVQVSEAQDTWQDFRAPHEGLTHWGAPKSQALMVVLQVLLASGISEALHNGGFACQAGK